MNELLNDRSQKISDTQIKKAEARKKIKSLSDGSKWNLVQRHLMEVQADCILRQAKDEKVMEFSEQYDLLKLKLELEYADQPEMKEAVFSYLPTPRGCSNWLKLNGWQDEVMAVLRKGHLFSSGNRVEVITSLCAKAKAGDVQAAKVWLTMSGDYSDKIEMGDAKFEKYKEYANILQVKNIDSD